MHRQEPVSGTYLTGATARLVARLERRLLESSYASMWTLAESLLGYGTVRVLDSLESKGRAALSPIDGRWVIYLRRGLSERDQEEGIAHELAEWILAEGRVHHPDLEALASHIADRLLMYVAA